MVKTSYPQVTPSAQMQSPSEDAKGLSKALLQRTALASLGRQHEGLSTPSQLLQHPQLHSLTLWARDRKGRCCRWASTGASLCTTCLYPPVVMPALTSNTPLLTATVCHCLQGTHTCHSRPLSTALVLVPDHLKQPDTVHISWRNNLKL